MVCIQGIFGSVIGDIAGSSHESKPVKVKRVKLFNKKSRITDDTVLTMAVAEWMLDRSHIVTSLVKWALELDNVLVCPMLKDGGMRINRE